MCSTGAESDKERDWVEEEPRTRPHELEEPTLVGRTSSNGPGAGGATKPAGNGARGISDWLAALITKSPTPVACFTCWPTSRSRAHHHIAKTLAGTLLPGGPDAPPRNRPITDTVDREPLSSCSSVSPNHRVREPQVAKAPIRWSRTDCTVDCPVVRTTRVQWSPFDEKLQLLLQVKGDSWYLECIQETLQRSLVDKLRSKDVRGSTAGHVHPCTRLYPSSQGKAASSATPFQPMAT